jgi:hypothetical protein
MMRKHEEEQKRKREEEEIRLRMEEEGREDAKILSVIEEKLRVAELTLKKQLDEREKLLHDKLAPFEPKTAAKKK